MDLKFKQGNTLYKVPGFYTFNISSDTITSDSNMPLSYDSTLNINGKLFHPYEPDTASGLVDAGYSGVLRFFNQNFEEIYLHGCGPSIPLGSGIIKNISFSNDTDTYWNQIIDYSVDILIPYTGLSTPGLSGYYLSSVEEKFSISKKDEYLGINTNELLNSDNSDQYSGAEYTVVRTLSAVGKHGSPSGALYYARSGVKNLLQTSTLGDTIKSLSVFDRSVVIDADEIAGSYTLTETLSAYTGTSGLNHWKDKNKKYTNIYDVNISYSKELKRTVTINGNIRATNFDYMDLEVDNNLFNPEHPGTGYDARYHFLKRIYTTEISSRLYTMAQKYMYNKSFDQNLSINASTYTGLRTLLKRGPNGTNPTILPNFSGSTFRNGQLYEFLNPTPIDYKVTFNPDGQSIDYSISFDNSPLPLITGAVSEQLECIDNHGQNLYVAHDIHFGTTVLQDLNTYGSNTRTVTYTATLPRYYYDYYSVQDYIKRNVEKIVDAFDPSYISQSTKDIKFLTKFDTTLDSNGRYQMNKSWEW